MSNFEEIKAGLKDKWLDYYEVNQSWICNLGCWVKGPEDGSRRPNAHVILTAISSLEPKIIDYLIPLVEINPDGEQVVKALGLNFRPKTELEKRAEERSKNQEAEIIPLITDIDPDTEYLNQFRNQGTLEN